jgi:hypothetical protein
VPLDLGGTTVGLSSVAFSYAANRSGRSEYDIHRGGLLDAAPNLFA